MTLVLAAYKSVFSRRLGRQHGGEAISEVERHGAVARARRHGVARLCEPVCHLRHGCVTKAPFRVHEERRRAALVVRSGVHHTRGARNSSPDDRAARGRSSHLNALSNEARPFMFGRHGVGC